MNWVKIKDFHYSVSETGLVRNDQTNKIIAFGKQRKKLVSSVKQTYLYVRLWKGNIRVGYRVHKLVADAFLSKPHDIQDLTVDHIDGDIYNNHFSNLRWISRSENSILANRYRRVA